MQRNNVLNSLRCAWILLLVMAASLVQAQTFLAPERAFQMQARMISPDAVAVRYDISRQYYMYRERFEFEVIGAPFELSEIELPPGVVKYDPTFEKDMALFFKTVEFVLPLPTWPATAPIEPFVVLVISQGCAEAGLCYPPMTSALQLLPSNEGYTLVAQQGIVDEERPFLASPISTATQAPISGWRALLGSSDDSGFARALGSATLWQNILLFFVLGALLALTPCVLPMIPILSVLIVGQGQQVSRTKGFTLAVAYVFGMSVVYTLLGVAAGLSGAGLAAWLQAPWVLSLFAVLLVLFGLAMFDVIRFEMPSSIQTRLTSTAATFKAGRLWAALAMGAISALIVGPCVAAPLAGALLYISQTSDWILGATALFAMAWGMGLPLLVMGASAGRLLPKAGPWMNGIKGFFGVLLFATAWWMVTPLLPIEIQILGWAILAGLSAVLLGAFDRLPAGLSLGAALRKTMGLILALLTIIWLVGLATGGRSLLQPLSHLVGTSTGQAMQTARAAPEFQRVHTVAELEALLTKSTRPVMLDFYADWCVSCKEMEAFTFTHPDVQQRMAQFELLKADVTANTSEHRALLKRFRLFGPPGIIFFEPGGRELTQIRVVGFQNAQRFVQTLDQALNR
jgi:thiol:disulfide interchange protein DsbD